MRNFNLYNGVHKMSQEILLLEDDDSLNHSVSLKLKKEGYTVHSAFSIEEAVKLFQTFSISLILCDITLPDGSGLDFCSRIRKESKQRVFSGGQRQKRSVFCHTVFLRIEDNIAGDEALGIF